MQTVKSTFYSNHPSTDLQIFKNPEFGEVRTIAEGDTVLFCGSDVARALGYVKPQNAISSHCRGALKRGIPTTSGEQDMLFIPESDLYRLVFRSKLPSAEKFTDWVTQEVLPSIRKHGTYMTPEALQMAILNPDYLLEVVTALKAETDRRRELEALNEHQRQLLADYEPKIQYIDTILSSTGTMATTQIAADYNLSARKLNQILHESGVQYNVNGQWILYRNKMGLGYTKSITIPIVRADGRADTKLHTHWTQKGRLMIHELLTAKGYQAKMDI